MSLTVACLARNEAGKFWKSALEVWGRFADQIVVLDDSSTDDTAKIAEAAGATVFRRDASIPAWGAEAPARAQLFDLAVESSPPHSYIMVLDADMIPAKDPRPLLEAIPAKGRYAPVAVNFYLYDLWAEDHFRKDGAWFFGPYSPRTWIIQRPDERPADGWRWFDAGIHCGHFPLDTIYNRAILAPREYSLLHYAYVTPELRQAKAQQYSSIADQLKEADLAHAESILADPVLEKLPFVPQYRLTCAS